MAARTPAPLYVEYGGTATTPQPDLVKDCVLYGFFPKADLAKLQTLCDKVFKVPSKGAVNCNPLLDRVMLTFGSTPRIRPQLPPYNQMGYAAEKQVAFWIPVEVCRKSKAKSFPRLAWFVPYMWVDNPLSLCGGREIFGWAKNWGSMILDPKAGFTLQAYGGNFNSNSPSDFCPLIDTTPISAAASKPMGLGVTVLEWLVREAVGLLETEFHGLFDGFARVSTPIIFLKQFRSVSDGRAASVQEITGAETKVTRVKPLQALPTKYQLTIRHLDSHDITADLGITNQTLSAGFQVKMDFTLRNGITLWP
jgi:Acetoacetate decarboxylase (ADC)